VHDRQTDYLAFEGKGPGKGVDCGWRLGEGRVACGKEGGNKGVGIRKGDGAD